MRQEIRVTASPKSWTNSRVWTERAHPVTIPYQSLAAIVFSFFPRGFFTWYLYGKVRALGITLALPAPVARSVRSVQALKVLAWDEYVVSLWLQVTTGIPVAKVSAGTLLLGYKWISEGNAAAKGWRKWVHDVTQTPIRRAKRLQFVSPDESIRRILF